MCGIAGYISFGGTVSDRRIDEVRIMTSFLMHRGPDSAGFFHDDNVVIGNRRLNIIDLRSAANMPMCNEDGTVLITYNGEITNYKELRSEFGLDKKHRFKTDSDTEVLIHLYEELGIDCLNKLSGMFAFCLYDMLKQKVYIVRDFYGIRPLFYTYKNNGIYFASEIKAFLDIENFSDEIDCKGIWDYFTLAYIPGDKTPFKDLKELGGGEYFEVNLSNYRVARRTYYKYKYEENIFDISFDEAKKNVYELILDSVKRNMISDVPLGMTLSGGFDTSTILAAAKILGVVDKMHTYSISMGEDSFDESYYQRLMAEFSGSVHHEIKVMPEDVMNALVEHMAYMDEPSGDGAAIPSYILAREAKKDVKVLLSGEGGDEVFNAYETHRAYVARKLYRKYIPYPLRKIVKNIVFALPSSYKKLSFDFIAKRFVEGSELDIPASHIFWRHVLTEREKVELMPDMKFSYTDELFRDFFRSLKYKDDLNKISHMDIIYYFICDLMVKNDRTFMAHSIEARFPFMDRILHEFVANLPASFRIRGFTGRYIQKEAMKPHLPKEIYNRTNMGLEMPHSIWFLNDMKGLADKYFTKKEVEKSGLFSWNTVNKMWNAHRSKKKDYGRALWSLINFMVWFDLFVWNKDYKSYLKGNSYG